MTRPVLLGFDVSPRKVGIGIVLDETGLPPADNGPDCAFETLDGPESVRGIVGALSFGLNVRRLEPMVAYLERPDHSARGGAGQLDAGIAIGMWWYALRAFWPHLVIDTITATSWRSKVGLGADAVLVQGWRSMTKHERRRWWKAEAVREAHALGFDLPTVGERVVRPSDDAAEGALIARACWVDAEAGRIDGLRVKDPFPQ